ncbi:esterase/lipase family protein [Blastococcus capsensis]|uniref:esterase/lipase family protein n=1 Tax=Blastococcus capsensis TaxID=1564163 RepID=UPI002540B0FD|nr:alpha/beta hydrolase [Blastococcus capsensis]MDK3255792.1 alpha/beta hydrolase [Blastococcus capsensis]
MTTRPAPARGERADTLLALTEPARALVSVGALAAGLPLLRLAPRGEPHPVVVLPGWLASDVSTRTLRRWLGRLGYPTVGWDLGRNHGSRPEVVEGVRTLVERLVDEHGTPVSIVGQSLGGIFARRLAERSPRLVRQVVSLGSPFAAVAPRPRRPSGAGVYREYRRLRAVEQVRPAPALSVPSTSVYSRWDGVVDWRGCLQEEGRTSENVAVHASHLGMGVDPAVLWIVADRLAQPAAGWRPFVRPTRFGLRALFPAD